MRLFLAINLPGQLKKDIIAVQRELLRHARAKPVEEENIHITLKFLGDVSDSDAGQIKKELDKVDFSAFEASIKGLGVFPNQNFIKVVWVGVDKGFKEICDLNNRIESLKNFEKDKRFHPHATIARVKNVTDKKGLIDFLDEHKNHMFGSFEAKSFDLMKSELSPKGPAYSILKEYS